MGKTRWSTLVNSEDYLWLVYLGRYPAKQAFANRERNAYFNYSRNALHAQNSSALQPHHGSHPKGLPRRAESMRRRR
jgi:hypothetical protein